MQEKKNILTYEGLKKYEDELTHLKVVRRQEVAQKIKEAREQGDLSENAEYDAARSAQAEVENKIKELEVMIENAVVITEINTDKVSIGNTVIIKYVDDDETEEYTIVGSKEADPFSNKISNESPIARAILNKKVKEIVSVDSPNGKYDIEIVKIS